MAELKKFKTLLSQPISTLGAEKPTDHARKLSRFLFEQNLLRGALLARLPYLARL